MNNVEEVAWRMALADTLEELEEAWQTPLGAIGGADRRTIHSALLLILEMRRDAITTLRNHQWAGHHEL